MREHSRRIGGHAEAEARMLMRPLGRITMQGVQSFVVVLVCSTLYSLTLTLVAEAPWSGAEWL